MEHLDLNFLPSNIGSPRSFFVDLSSKLHHGIKATDISAIPKSFYFIKKNPNVEWVTERIIRFKEYQVNFEFTLM